MDGDPRVQADPGREGGDVVVDGVMGDGVWDGQSGGLPAVFFGDIFDGFLWNYGIWCEERENVSGLNDVPSFLIWVQTVGIVVNFGANISWAKVPASEFQLSNGRYRGWIQNWSGLMVTVSCPGAFAALGMRAQEACGWPRRNLASPLIC